MCRSLQNFDEKPTDVISCVPLCIATEIDKETFKRSNVSLRYLFWNWSNILQWLKMLFRAFYPTPGAAEPISYNCRKIQIESNKSESIESNFEQIWINRIKLCEFVFFLLCWTSLLNQSLCLDQWFSTFGSGRPTKQNKTQFCDPKLTITQILLYLILL